jgi:hypothetical protein
MSFGEQQVGRIFIFRVCVEETGFSDINSHLCCNSSNVCNSVVRPITVKMLASFRSAGT